MTCVHCRHDVPRTDRAGWCPACASRAAGVASARPLLQAGRATRADAETLLEACRIARDRGIDAALEHIYNRRNSCTKQR